MFKFLNQCFARLRFWKSVSSTTAVAPSSRFCESETLFQNQSCAKHWFKNLNILGPPKFCCGFFHFNSRSFHLTAIWMCTWLMEKTETWNEHRNHAELTETSNNWAFAVLEVPNDYCTKKHPAQRYTYRVLQTIQMKLILLCVWAEPAVLGSMRTALKFKYEIQIG